jgi:hypothetical protein
MKLDILDDVIVTSSMELNSLLIQTTSINLLHYYVPQKEGPVYYSDTFCGMVRRETNHQSPDHFWHDTHWLIEGTAYHHSTANLIPTLRGSRPRQSMVIVRNNNPYSTVWWGDVECFSSLYDRSISQHGGQALYLACPLRENAEQLFGLLKLKYTTPD